jgi:hypothetical protein
MILAFFLTQSIFLNRPEPECSPRSCKSTNPNRRYRSSRRLRRGFEILICALRRKLHAGDRPRFESRRMRKPAPHEYPLQYIRSDYHFIAHQYSIRSCILHHVERKQENDQVFSQILKLSDMLIIFFHRVGKQTRIHTIGETRALDNAAKFVPHIGEKENCQYLVSLVEEVLNNGTFHAKPADFLNFTRRLKYLE